MMMQELDTNKLDMEKLSPMMKEYIAQKKQYKDCVMFYRLGDFYEMFFDDAIKVSKELELTLTGRACGLKERAPMCGVPFHSVDAYLNRLVKKGYKVAICEQLEDPKEAKGIVKRGVIRIVTPGSTLSAQSLEASTNNYIISIIERGGVFGIALCDITTGDFYCEELRDIVDVKERILKTSPSEILYKLENINIEDLTDKKTTMANTPIETLNTSLDDESDVLLKQFKVYSLDSLSISGFTSGVYACAELLKYLESLQKTSLKSVRKLHVFHDEDYMYIDYSTRRNLELTETMRDKNKVGSFLNVIDKTKTAMGARKLRSMVLEPLVKKSEIIKRQDFIEALVKDYMLRDEIRELLAPIYDFERLLCRITYGTANPRDMKAFMSSLKTLPDIKYALQNIDCKLSKECLSTFDSLDDLYSLIEVSISDEPPVSTREGGIIKDGFSEMVDNLRYVKNNGKSLLTSIEEEEKKKTGITTLKVKYNKVFGYFIEISKGQLDKVPDYYDRKQTLTNSERFIVPKLKELEDTILGAQDKLSNLEYDLFCEIRDKVALEVKRVQESAKVIAKIDALTSLAHVAVKNNYVRPEINEEGILEIKNGRHAVVEKVIGDSDFIPNDTLLDMNDNRLSIITGPNMAGKSTYMRQVALIQLMGQIGSFVPCDSANIGIVDRIFTRVGASDDLASGQSTFMVEMNEVSNILKNATKNSLIILDEIGRGTSTYDGLSIAWAVTEEIADKNSIGAKTLFATHYHELTSLEGKLEGVKNFSIAVEESGDDIIFLRKVIRGGANRSYGIEVAKLAGVPEKVVSRAKTILKYLVSNNQDEKINALDNSLDGDKEISLLDEKELEILEEIKSLDINNMTPIEVVSYIQNLKKHLH